VQHQTGSEPRWSRDLLADTHQDAACRPVFSWPQRIDHDLARPARDFANQGVQAVGVTAGASAPEQLVEDVVEALRQLAQVELEVLPGIDENVRFRMPPELQPAS